jgi:PAS domain S-box-containing protein
VDGDKPETDERGEMRGAMRRLPVTAPSPVWLGKVAAMGVGYYVTAKLGLRLASVNPYVTAVWPPTGVAVAGLLLLGRRAWPGVALAAFLANLTSGAAPLLAWEVSVGNTLAPVAAVTLLRAWGTRADLTRLGDVLALLGAGVASMLISATSGTLSLLATGNVTGVGALRVWPVWWVGDAMGVVLVAPFLLALTIRAGSPYPSSRRRMAESAAVLLAAVGASQLIFGSTLVLTFLAFPLALWAAVRLPQPVVATLNLIMAGSAIWATLHGHGPFHQPGAGARLADLQAFNGTVACTSLVLAAVVRERTLAHRRLQEAAAGLEAAVERRTRELSATNRALAASIAEHRQVVLTLRESEERFRSFFEGSVEGAYRVRLDGSFLAVNPAAARMLGYVSPAEFIEQVPRVHELLVDPERGRELEQLAETLGEVRDFEIELCHRDGGTVRAAVHLRTMDAHGEVLVEGILVDVGERQRAREALLAAYEREHRAAAELQRLNGLKDTFIANISHEFRTPITLTLGPLHHVLTGECGELTAEVATQLQLAERSQHRLLRLVDQLLDLARLEQGAVKLRVSRVADVNRLLEEWTVPFHTVAELRGVAVRLRLDPRATNADLWLDHDEFDVVLNNLVSNALKFTPRGHVEISTELRAGALLLTVADTGTGIAEHDLPHVFDRFWQGGEGSSNRRGTGLGLALVKEIVALHGGEISACSSPGAGTAFQVSLPLGTAHFRPDTVWKPSPASNGRLLSVARTVEIPEDGGEIEAANQATEAAFDEDKPVVLYVEDVHDLRVRTRHLLADECNVYLAVDGREGLELTRRYHPDLVIVDELMPRMSGTEFVRELRSDPDLHTTPVIFVTALAGAEARVAGLQMGADDYLAKPFHEGELRARVRNLLNGRIQRRLLVDANRRLEIRVEEQLAELARTGELRRFLPRAVGDRLLAGELGPQQAMTRNRVTVVILSVAGFTQLAEQLEPEDFAEVVNSYLAEVTAVAATHGGVVDHLAGDGLMVLFGAPHGGEIEDQAWSAVQAALAMRERLVEVATACHRRGIALDLQVRAGVNTGHATIGIFGSDLLRTYTAMGAVVSLAARLRDEAAPGQILCGGITHAAVSSRVLSRRRDPLNGRGAGRRVEVYELCEATVLAGQAHSGTTLELTATSPGWPADGVRDRPIFRREGGYWTIAFDEGPVFRLQDRKGLGYLAQLLGHPGTEFHVLQLVATDRGGEAGPAEGEWVAAGPRLRSNGDLGEVLDAPARAAYLQRLEELRADLDEGTSFHDFERVARARAEMDALKDQLRHAIGLSGRGRRTGSDVERARVNLTKRIRAAMTAIGEHDPRLEHHLRGAVHTGSFCCYAPDPAEGPVWTL